jgi:hypothetical protein
MSMVVGREFKQKVGKGTFQIAYPDECPRCGRTLIPEWLTGTVCPVEHHPGVQRLQAAYRCTSDDCGEMFIANYDRGISQQKAELAECVPMAPPQVSLSAHIQQTSPDFPKIYTQALQADADGLDRIAGVALRKALEFLIKDYCKSLTSDEQAKTEIEKLLLGRCIDKHVSNEHVKQCAKRAAWLGNDETHYVRRWTDKDVKDLKTLIELTLHWIESELLTKKFLAEMPES